MFKLFSFECKKCEEIWEDLVKEKESPCPICETISKTTVITVPNLGKFSMASPEEKKRILKKRSEEHTTKEVRKEPERWGQAGIERAKGK